tara:strand:+ start:173 stop:409 length:237 start_codon:yes stop_codon:yes gene_type:complete
VVAAVEKDMDLREILQQEHKQVEQVDLEVEDQELMVHLEVILVELQAEQEIHLLLVLLKVIQEVEVITPQVAEVVQVV